MGSDLARRLSERADRAGITITPALRDSLATYFDVLTRWNAKINLTALTDGDEAIDRLLVEPLLAAASLPHDIQLMDLGSGGGSPAIPLGLALNATRLVMVESRERKAAFLREASRAAGIVAEVEARRFEDLATGETYRGAMDLVSVRAVRMDAPALDSAGTFLRTTGQLALFVSLGATIPIPEGFRPTSRRPLLQGSEMLLLSPDVPRGTS